MIALYLIFNSARNLEVRRIVRKPAPPKTWCQSYKTFLSSLMVRQNKLDFLSRECFKARLIFHVMDNWSLRIKCNAIASYIRVGLIRTASIRLGFKYLLVIITLAYLAGPSLTNRISFVLFETRNVTWSTTTASSSSPKTGENFTKTSSSSG